MKIFLMVLLAIASLILIASVLLQSGNSAGLSGSIAGGENGIIVLDKTPMKHF